MKILILFLFATTAQANQHQSHKEGQTCGKSLLNGVKGTSQSANLNDIPGFETASPKEMYLTDQSLGNAATNVAQSDDAAQWIKEQANDRETFKIDPSTDPLFTNANEAITDSEKTLQETITEMPGENQTSSYEIKTCEESGDEYPQSCKRELKIELKVTPEKGHYKNATCNGHWKSKIRGTKKYCKERCKNSKYVIDQPRQVNIIKEEWLGNCNILESLVDQGLCRYVSNSTSPKNETRKIQGEPITRDHFEEHNHYSCFKTVPKTCAGLREKGCYQVSSLCKEKVGNKCVLWEQTYRCPTGKQSRQTHQSSNAFSPFCLTGNCADTSYGANGEMLQVISQLAVLREAQNDLKKNVQIFKGEDQRCSRNCLNFKDCCGNDKGWGVSIHLAECTSDEKKLADLRQKNQCVQVGTYCDEKMAGQCIRKKTSFCCYGTKLARLIQENARKQLKIRWGTPEKPNCNGLSPEQLSKIDFSKIDFSELFADIKKQMVAKGQDQALAGISADRLQNNMTILTNPSLHPEAHQTLKEKGL